MKPSTFRSAFWPVLWGEWVPEMPVSGCGAHTTPPALSSVLSTPAVQTFACQVSCTTPSNYSLNCPACARPVPIGIQCLQSSSRPSLPLALRLEPESNCPRLPPPCCLRLRPSRLSCLCSGLLLLDFPATSNCHPCQTLSTTSRASILRLRRCPVSLLMRLTRLRLQSSISSPSPSPS